jgi:hypothetical protein
VNETTGEISPAMTDSIRRIGEVNFQILALGHDCEVGFEHQDMWISDPLRSSCSRFVVDPVATYGDAFLKGPFVTDPGGSLERAMAQFERVSRESGPLMPFKVQVERPDTGEGRMVEVEAVDEWAAGIAAMKQCAFAMTGPPSVYCVWNAEGELVRDDAALDEEHTNL